MHWPAARLGKSKSGIPLSSRIGAGAFGIASSPRSKGTLEDSAPSLGLWALQIKIKQ